MLVIRNVCRAFWLLTAMLLIVCYVYQAFEGDSEAGVVAWGSPLPAGVTAVRVRLVVLRARVYGMHLARVGE